jgi:uncharacterized protein (DUF362 family)
MLIKENLFVRDGRSLVSKVKCNGDLKDTIKHSVALIGGISKLVKKGDTILLKPNYNTADPYLGSSDPNFIRAVIENTLRSWSRESRCWRKIGLSRYQKSFGNSGHHQSL